MKKLFFITLFMLCTVLTKAQNLYLKTFGKSGDTPLIFLHGGPGGSTLDFEISTAQKLAEKGFFVIVYERRGEGRSEDEKAAYTFQQTIHDLNQIYKQYNLASASLLGHSFGGIVATKFATANPEKVKNIILAGAPVNLQMTFKAILNTVQNVLETKKDSVALKQLDFVKKQDTTSIYYSSGAFMLAMQNGLYNTKTPDSSAIKRYSELIESPVAKAYFENMAKTNYKSMYTSSMGFFNNEKYTTLAITEELHNLKSIPIYGLYGKEDGLFDEKQITLIRSLTKDFVYLDSCSHNAFMDKQDDFIKTLIKWLK